MKKHSILVVVVFMFACSALLAAQTTNADPWTAWEFLVGRWTAVGGGTPGQGAGSTSFEFDLNRRVLVRKNHVEYPATKERAPFTHDDLLITYKDRSADRWLADYWDNEGHAIHYTATALADGSIQFVSLPAPGPAFRMTYFKEGADGIRIRFEIATPDKPGEFKVYVEGTARREKLVKAPPMVFGERP